VDVWQPWFLDINPWTHPNAAFNPGMGSLKSGHADYPTSYFITRVLNQKVSFIFCKKKNRKKFSQQQQMRIV
jgi:hypothetical protein